MLRNGTVQSNGQIYPLYERAAYQVQVIGQIDAGAVETAESLKTELLSVLEQYGVGVKVNPVMVLEAGK